MEWISPNQGNILSEIEGKIIEPIEIEIGGSNNYEITKVSGNFPNGISLVENNGSYSLQGTLDLVEETTKYYFTLQAKDLDTEEYIQRWFSITVETLDTEWSDENPLYFEELEKLYFSYKFKLENPEGNEIYKKIVGELPEGVFLSNNGLLYGVPEEDRTGEYSFQIGIYRKNKLIFTSPKITIKVNDISNYNYPIWITDSGIIGYIDYNESKPLHFMAYDPKGRTITYELLDENGFPIPGIKFTENTRHTGYLEGTCKTKMSDDWHFNVRASNGETYTDREFVIITNSVEDSRKIKWITETLEDAPVGYNYNHRILTKCEDKVYYEIIYGELPKGLYFSRDGVIYGNVDLQDYKNYSFTVRAYTTLIFDTREFSINVVEGLSETAVDTYLYINKENDNEYYKMMSMYDKTSAYESYNTLYKVSSTPKIDIATLKTWDNILLKYQFEQFNTPININWKETKKKKLEDYDFIYKDFIEDEPKSEVLELKEHSENDSIMFDRFNNPYIPGYIREHVPDYTVKINFYDRNGNKVASTDDVKSMDKIRFLYSETFDSMEYYYDPTEEFDPDGNDMKLVSSEFLPQKDITDYAEFSKMFVIEDIDDLYTNRKYIYVQPILEGNLYEKESMRLLNKYEKVYYKEKELDTGETIIEKYIIKNNKKVYVETMEKPGYVAYNPVNKVISTIVNDEIIDYGKIEDNKVYELVGKIEDNNLIKFRLKIGTIENNIIYDNNGNEKGYIDENNNFSFIEYNNDVLKGRIEDNKVYELIGNINENNEIIRTLYNTDDSIKDEYIAGKIEDNKIAIWKIGVNELFQTVEEDSLIVLDIRKYDRIRYTNTINEYYKYNSEPITYKTASIEEIRNIFKKEINVEKLEGDYFYKVGNQQIAGTYDDYKYKIYYIKQDKDNDYYIDYDGDESLLYVWEKTTEDKLKQVFTVHDGEVKPVLQTLTTINGTVNYESHLIYREDDEPPLLGTLFIAEWDESLKYICEYNEEKDIYEWFQVKEIENPYVYRASENKDYGYDKDIVLPYVKDEHVIENKLQFTDDEMDNKLLPDYMINVDISSWKEDTQYKIDDEVIYNQYIYKCKENHKSGDTFDENYWNSIGYYKQYKPTLPLFYAMPNSQNAILRKVNEYEKEGNYWYDRKFIFYEVHFSPRYLNKDTFTIDFYNHKNPNSPEFLLI